MINVVLILGCWAVSFLFAGIEAGLLAVDPVRLRSQVKQNRRAALRLDRLLKHPERLLVTVLLVTNLADILALLILTHVLVARLGTLGFVAAFAIALPVYVFVLGVLPKSLFRRFPFRALAVLAGLLEIVSTILWPLLELGKQLGRLFLPRQRNGRAHLFAAREELKQIAIQSEREGSLTSAERALIHSAVDFTGVKVRDVMIPLSSAVTVAPQDPIDEVVKLSAATQIDRLPVITPTRTAVGLVNVLDILLDKNDARPLSEYTRRILTALEHESAYRILRRLRAARLGLAAVMNAEKELTGIVTVEELIKRLVSSVETPATS